MDKKSKTTKAEVGVGGDAGTALLTAAHFRRAGEYLLHSMLVMKHNGAVEKTRIGLTLLTTQVCERPTESLHQVLNTGALCDKDTRGLRGAAG